METYKCPDCQQKFRSDNAPVVCPLCGYEPDGGDAPGSRGGFAIGGFNDD